MATIHEYYEKDFNHNTKVKITVPFDKETIEGTILYDFAGYFAFISLYIPQSDKDLAFFIDLLANLKYGASKVTLGDVITLPKATEFPGLMKINNSQEFEILAQFYGDPDWISTKNMQASKRVFIYSETNLSIEDINILKIKAREFDHEVHFRDNKFAEARSKFEKPFAFISYDSRDRGEVARKVATGLQRMLCPVWYDEFSLKIGDNLRQSIEKGLKECKKCILVLSPNFLSNNGWTKTEFDSVFTRQLLEEQKLVLPIWYKVAKKDVYEYSPSLLNIKGVNWEELGEEEVCKQLYKVLMD